MCYVLYMVECLEASMLAGSALYYYMLVSWALLLHTLPYVNTPQYWYLCYIVWNIQHAHGHNKPLTVLCTYHRMFYAVGTAALCQRHYCFIYFMPCSVVGVVPWAVLLHYYMPHVLCQGHCRFIYCMLHTNGSLSEEFLE